MLREFIIRALGLLLILHTVSPVCHALGKQTTSGALASAVVTPAKAVNDLITAEPADRALGETCWFHAAHLFKSTPVQQTGLILPVIAVVVGLAVAVIALQTGCLRPLFLRMPERPPPSQPYLQTFRI